MERINLTLLSGLFQVWQRCIKSGNEFSSQHEEGINNILKNLPSGSGIDAGVKFDWINSKPGKLIFTFGFHFMDDNGYYDGWGDFVLVVVPTFGHFDLLLKGRDRRNIKEYLYELFDNTFTV